MNIAGMLAQHGQQEDNASQGGTVAHVAQGEVVIPDRVIDENPTLMSALIKAFGNSGMNWREFMVDSQGATENKVNPVTGMPEFYVGGGATGAGERDLGETGGREAGVGGRGDGIGGGLITRGYGQVGAGPQGLGYSGLNPDAAPTAFRDYDPQDAQDVRTGYTESQGFLEDASAELADQVSKMSTEERMTQEGSKKLGRLMDLLGDYSSGLSTPEKMALHNIRSKTSTGQTYGQYGPEAFTPLGQMMAKVMSKITPMSVPVGGYPSQQDVFDFVGSQLPGASSGGFNALTRGMGALKGYEQTGQMDFGPIKEAGMSIAKSLDPSGALGYANDAYDAFQGAKDFFGGGEGFSMPSAPSQDFIDRYAGENTYSPASRMAGPGYGGDYQGAGDRGNVPGWGGRTASPNVGQNAYRNAISGGAGAHTPTMAAPSYLGMPQGLTDLQKRTWIATQATQGSDSRFLDDQTYDYYKDLLLGALSGGYEAVMPIEHQYLQQSRGKSYAPDVGAIRAVL